MLKKALIILTILVAFSIPAYAGTNTTSGVTAQTVIDTVRADLNEATEAFWADSEFITWMDEAITDITNKTRCMETAPFSILLAENDYDYAITPSFLDIETVIYDSGDTTSNIQIYALERVDLRILGHERETGRPKEYCLWNDTMLLWPVPDSTASGDSVYLYTISLPSGVTTSISPIETPAYFDPAVIDFVKAQAYYKDTRISLGNYHMSLYTEKIKAYFESIVNRRNIPPEPK